MAKACLQPIRLRSLAVTGPWEQITSMATKAGCGNGGLPPPRICVVEPPQTLETTTDALGQ